MSSPRAARAGGAPPVPGHQLPALPGHRARGGQRVRGARHPVRALRQPARRDRRVLPVRRGAHGGLGAARLCRCLAGCQAHCSWGVSACTVCLVEAHSRALSHVCMRAGTAVPGAGRCAGSLGRCRIARLGAAATPRWSSALRGAAAGLMGCSRCNASCTKVVQ